MACFHLTTALATALSVAGAGQAQATPEKPPAETAPPRADVSGLLAGFMDPPNVARARTWWHWMNGNVTDAGIVADLRWMQRAGFGGAQFFDAGGSLASMRFVEPRLVYGDSNWRRAVGLAARTADGLGLELATASSPGWSETGGPWVTPAQAQKKYVWSELSVSGGKPVGMLPAPPRRTGPFADVPGPEGAASTPKSEFYADAKVVAYRQPSAERELLAPSSLGTAGGSLDPAKLTDGNLVDGQSVTGGPTEGFAWIRADYERPVTIRGLAIGTLAKPGADFAAPVIETSSDGVRWTVRARLHGPSDSPYRTFGFAPLTARHFRVGLYRGNPAPGLPGAPAPRPPSAAPTYSITEFALTPHAVVDRFVEKAGFTDPIVYDEAPSAAADRTAVIPAGAVVDVTDRLRSDGTLDWTPPRGRWRILRFGYTLTGQRNGPAPAEATGLEVDKFSAAHIKSYLDTFLAGLQAGTGPGMMGGKGLRNILSDSWEAGVQNWTDDMPRLFRERRGYELAPWLPVLAGRIVGSAEQSDQFLWDWRRTLQDLLAQHYATVREELHRRGMGYYAEAQGDSWRAIADGMEVKSRADIPMAEYWYEPFFAGPGQAALKADMKEAASVAHLYGRPLAANESLTYFAPNRPWSVSPAMMKPVIDEILAHGINRIVLHTTVHQPSDRAPGLGLGPFGQFVGRLDTWSEKARPLLDYVARASWLLQQGRDVADIAYFYGEERPLVSLFKGAAAYDAVNDRLRTDVPAGYNYDFINAETLRDATTVGEGRLRSSGGGEYHILYLPRAVDAMTPATLARLVTLVEQGVVLVGPKPARPLGLKVDRASFASMVGHLWGDGSRSVRKVGRGKVYVGGTLAEALAAERIARDVAAPSGAPGLLQVHRAMPDGTQIYFLVNRGGPIATEATFRVAGRTPRLWNADDGSITPVSYRSVDGGIAVPVKLAKRDSMFLVFEPGPTAGAVEVPASQPSPIAVDPGPWTVAFEAGRGAPASVAMPILKAWNENDLPGIRYFSGTASYTSTLTVAATEFKPGRRMLIDLGEVHEVAELFVNGKRLGIAWKPPYVVDATAALRPGRNELKVSVTNLWANRLIGDAAARKRGEATIGWTAANLPADQRGNGFSASWSPTAPLLSSGLLGPVRVIAETRSPPIGTGASRP